MLKAYFANAIYLSAFIALTVGVSHPRMKKSTEFGAGVLLICIILLPLVDIIKDIDVKIDVRDYLENIETEAADDVLELAFEEGIREYISDEYRLDWELIIVMVDGFDLECMRAERIYITLSGKATLADYKGIEKEVGKEFTKSGECEVSVKLG